MTKAKIEREYNMKHIICFSGGHSSALVALEVANRYGTENMILLNHDISSKVELEDIKRFKKEIANYLGLTITYANYKNLDVVDKDQFDVSIENKAIAVKTSSSNNVLCTHRLKTKPFNRFLETQSKDSIIYYGFDAKERNRIERRQKILNKQGFKSDYPLALWYENDIYIYNKSFNQLDLFADSNYIEPKFKGYRKFLSTNQIGIKPPLTYSEFKHANCLGCLKAGKQHWYVIFCNYPEIWEKAKYTELVLGQSILKSIYLKDLEVDFVLMKEANIEATEHIESSLFWYQVKKIIKKVIQDEQDLFSCSVECIG